ncbi:MAG: transcription termination factor Rho [Prevotella sp.]|nr:transcription termination factor Rho [Prevotella sp.]
MAKKDELMAEEVASEPQKKRTRIAKKDTSDHVYSVSGDKGENLDQAKKKRTRTKKTEAKAEAVETAAELPTEVPAEQVAEPVAEAAAETQPEPVGEVAEPVAETAEEAVPAEPKEKVAEEPVKRKRGRKSKEEIMAAAEAAAAALAMKTQTVASADENKSEAKVPETEQQLLFEEKAMEGLQDAVPEEAFANSVDMDEDGENTSNLLEQLQSKVNSKNAEVQNEGVWEGDPGDGTDFIIVNDIPVEDNAAIPYYDMFDNPQTSHAGGTDCSDNLVETEADFDFNDIITANGLLEIMPDGYGFLRSSDYNYLSSPDDVHLTIQQIKQYSLKTGDVVECSVRPPRAGEKYFTMSTIQKVNGRNPFDVRDRISFENLTPLFPEEKFNLCGNPSTTNLSTRIVDLFSPIGKGQRSLIVAQPKTGKTILMKDIANAIAANHPEAYIIMLLIDERPEEVTDMARTVNAEVIASTFDEPADRHVKIAGLVLEKAKRLVECGHDVVIFLDSITRLARAYNTVAPASGKVLTGGVDANALQKPKRFFGAARNIEGGGSLTIIATALTDTGSKMDEVIFEEFKGTGNSELQLDRQLANKRIFPAVNLIQSSTRRDDLLLDSFTTEKMWILRNQIADMNAQEAMNVVSNVMRRSKDHTEFLMGMNE